MLINQCPHNLDMLQWLMGVQPSRVTAVASLGKTHPIEVEDEVSAILEYPNGAIGHFMTTTGEAPGTNRLEVVGDRGKLIAEGEPALVRDDPQVREVYFGMGTTFGATGGVHPAAQFATSRSSGATGTPGSSSIGARASEDA